MIELELAQNTVEGGFFLLKQHRQVTPFDWTSDRGGEQHFLGTYRDSGSPIRDALLTMIRSSKRRVFVASFMLGDDELIDELIAAAHRLKGGVYVITALDEQSLGRGLREYEESEQESPEERKKNFQRLTSQGIYVRGHESCHAKIAIVDDRVALVGSANFVKQGFTWTGEANVLLCDPVQIRQLRHLFAELWYSGCTWQVPPGETYIVAERKPVDPPSRPKVPSGQPGDVVWTNGASQMSLVEAIQETIAAAQESLTVSSYSIVRMTEKPHLILNHLHDAVRRGVKVRMFVRQRNAWPEQMTELVALHDAGVEIVGDLRNHAKVAIADAKQAVIFSANFDGNHGLDSGVEVGVRVKDLQCMKELVRYMDHVIAYADTQFVRNPTLKQLDGQLAAKWCKHWTGGEKLRINCRSGDAKRFSHATSSGPVLYEHTGHELYLHAGDLTLEVNTSNDDWKGRLAEKPDGKLVETRLHEWLQGVRRSSSERSDIRRGFCPVTMYLETDCK